MGRSELLENLKEEYGACSRCKILSETRTNVVFGVGDPDVCKVVIIGEAPGKKEDIKNEPFVGRSGQVLNSLLAEIGLSRDEVYITNTILCRPPENRNPKREELKNCRDRLDMHIELLDPKVVITLGNFATKYMLDTKVGISKLHGKIVDVNGRLVIPMYHPAVLLYSGNSPTKRAELLADFKVVQKIIGSRPTILSDFTEKKI